MHCDRSLELIQPYIADELSETDRRAFRAHLSGCSDCRQKAAAEEPSLLFAAMPEPPVDATADARAEACAKAVTAMIRQQRLASDLERRHRVPRTWMAAAATIVIVLGASMLWQGSWLNDGPPAVPTPVVAEAVIEMTESAPPQVEVEMAGDGVRIYQMTQGENDNTAVCFVVNEAMEL